MLITLQSEPLLTMFKLTLALCILAVATAGDCKFTYQAWSKCSKAPCIP